MRKVLEIALTIFLLTASLSTASFADGGDPNPQCPPSQPQCIVG